MSRREFTKAVKLAAFQRSGGNCEGCTARLAVGRFEYHHQTEDTFAGEPMLENCQVLCVPCHSAITRKQAAVIAKSSRVRAKHLGIKRTSRPIPGSKASGLRKRMNGQVERRS